MFELRRGTNVFTAGTNEVNRLLMTNIAGRFEFNGGTLTSGQLRVSGAQLLHQAIRIFELKIANPHEV